MNADLVVDNSCEVHPVISPRFRHLGSIACLISLTYSALHAADAVAPAPVPNANTANPSDGSDQIYRDGLKLEINREWSKAADLYESAMAKWPQRTEFRQRLVLCEMHLRLHKRYQDQSFRRILLQMNAADCVKLYSEILTRIDNSYVDPVELSSLGRRGVDNLEVALRDPEFQRLNASQATTAQIQELRAWLRQNRSNVLAPNREKANEIVATIADTAWATARISRQAVYMEFIFGASDALDEFSSCLTPDKLEDLYAVIDGNFVGLGVELKDDPNGLVLTGVIRGGPAAEAGLAVGEVITTVDGQALQGLGLDQAASRLQGQEGSSVELVISHSGAPSRKVRLMRRPVDVESIVDVKMIDPQQGIGYLKMTGFQKTTNRELRTALEQLNSKSMKMLILDLRGNPGGLLNCSVEIADQFLSKGVIVTTRGRSDGQSQIYQAKPEVDWNFPLVILVDRDSASASEILAGALQENGRAEVMGERSFGKGSVQSIFPMVSVSAGLKLTTARFYSPLDRPYTQGVTPNIITRQVAKPNPEATSGSGNNAEDYVLRSAIEHARTKLGNVAGGTNRTIGASNSGSANELR